MLYEIEFQDDGPADVEIKLAGLASPAALREFTNQLEADPRFRAGLTLLVDVSGLEAGTLTEATLTALGEHVAARDSQTALLAVAIVADDPEIQKRARVYRATVGGSRSNRQIVSSRAEGLAWLEEQRTRSDA